MKISKIVLFTLITVLFTGLLLTGCPDDSGNTGSEQTDPDKKDPEIDTGTLSELEGKLLILQAYSSASDARGATHSFAELYNTTNEAIELNGIFLYYADGYSKGEPFFDEQKDKPWKKIALNGTIPALGSFLVLGPRQNTNVSGSDAARLQIADGYGDINDENFKLSNRAFKVALIERERNLNDVQNPFNADGEGAKISGYIDMVGAINTAYEKSPNSYDRIYGYETAPARCSKSEAVRRKNLKDTDNNQGKSSEFPNGTGDFDSIRYAVGDPASISDELLALRSPRNSTDTAEGWDPFKEPEEAQGPFVEAGDEDTFAHKLLILQAYGSSSDAAGASHSFVELYNTTDAAIELNGITLYYANGTRGLPHADKDGSWSMLPLNGSIPAGASFLILGPRQNTTGRHQISDNYGDINDSDFTLGNRSFKAAVIRNTAILTAQNPFDMDDNGAVAAGYIDMVGAANDPAHATNPDQILGFETAPARNSASVSVRRINLIDTDNNSVDFEQADYRVTAMDDDLLDIKRPKNSAYGKWDPFEEPEETGSPEPTENTLLILQAAAPNNNAANPVTYCFVELYNNGDATVDLTGYSLQFAEGGDNPSEDGAWVKIDLSGSIPSKNSFLILGKKTSANASPNLSIADGYGDINDDILELSNNAFKIVLLSNQTLLTSAVQNPFDIGSGSPIAGYIDMLGAINTGNAQYILGYETARKEGMTRQMGVRRKSLVDTDNNANDFECFSYGTASADVITAKRPRNSKTDGAWTPEF